jgi:hypothetical protein
VQIPAATTLDAIEEVMKAAKESQKQEKIFSWCCEGGSQAYGHGE